MIADQADQQGRAEETSHCHVGEYPVGGYGNYLGSVGRIILFSGFGGPRRRQRSGQSYGGHEKGWRREEGGGRRGTRTGGQREPHFDRVSTSSTCQLSARVLSGGGNLFLGGKVAEELFDPFGRLRTGFGRPHCAGVAEFVGDKRVGGCKDFGDASLQCIDLMLRL